jgi:hypothetical protein
MQATVPRFAVIFRPAATYGPSRPHGWMLARSVSAKRLALCGTSTSKNLLAIAPQHFPNHVHVTRMEQWCVEAKSPEEAHELLTAGAIA